MASADQAKALYERFIHQNSGSESGAVGAGGAACPARRKPTDPLRRRTVWPKRMFDLASVLNQTETIDLALLYDRFALALRPQFPLAQLLLADILSAAEQARAKPRGPRPKSRRELAVLLVGAAARRR